MTASDMTIQMKSCRHVMTGEFGFGEEQRSKPLLRKSRKEVSLDVKLTAKDPTHYVAGRVFGI
jgi:hypothetical protein